MSSYKRVAIVAAVAVCAFLHDGRVATAAPDEPGTEAASVRGYLESQGSPALAADERGAELWKVVQAFYFSRDYAPAWFRGERLTPGGEALLSAIAAADGEGLPADRYQPRSLLGALPQVVEAAAVPDDGRRVARLDVALTCAFLRYVSDLTAGAVDPRGAASLWRVATRAVDVQPALEEAVRSDAPVRVLQGLRPAHPQYAALVGALASYRRVAAAGGWPTLPATILKPARRASAAPLLRARLTASGDLASGGSVPAGIKAFQRRHGLRADGVVDRATLEALNVPVEDRVRQIELNLERWRWQGFDPGGRTILVNVPTFELHAYEGGREALRMRVITGAGDTQTPIFAEAMDQVVFSPHWTVPANILEAEVLPKIRKDPGYLARRNMEMVRSASGEVSVRQRPGPSNALGLVKFQFPNPFNVYLHDTPGDALFAQARRALSHGCVRLEKPEALARFVLRGSGWDDAAIARAMRSGREQFVTLPAPVPLQIAYFTTWVDDDGAVVFAPDVYRHDVAQARLFLPPAPPAPAAIRTASAR